jgi:hypothetical protein
VVARVGLEARVKPLALSLKQPWAALLVAGKKTIEVRRWRTEYRGPLLIHAARVDDDRREAWALVPDELRPATQLRGGIVGAGTLVEVKTYRHLDVFLADRAQHLNEPSWFEPAGLFGFCFTELRVVPFRRIPGYFKLFEVELDGLEVPPPAAAPAETVAQHSEDTTGSMLGAVKQRIRRLMRTLRRSSSAE